MNRRLMVINVVGLTHKMVGVNTPCISSLLQSGFSRPMDTIFPAVTCSVQATLLTGKMPSEHGIVSNGWYSRELAEVLFWKQSNHLISGERIYQSAKLRDPGHTTAKMFWWYNMYADVSWSVTPRPSYPADGRKVPDLYSAPPDLRDLLQQKLGPFPLFHFWGPTADILSTRWIADASVEIFRSCRPSLTLVYLPHLDYNMQRLGPDDPQILEDIKLVDREAGKLIDAAREQDAEVIVLSEYGITQVSRPIHINRILRDAGLLQVRREPLGWETLDCGASEAFAVADHQAAHVYVRDPTRVPVVRRLLESVDGIDRVMDRDDQKTESLDHPRSGDLICVSDPNAWFTWYFWQQDALAPDYARTVDIHRKPGYDPVELLIDPQLRFPRLRILRRLAQKLLGFRYYMDVIGLDATIIRGSHGRIPERSRVHSDGPVFISSSRQIECDSVRAAEVRNLLLRMQFGD